MPCLPDYTAKILPTTSLRAYNDPVKFRFVINIVHRLNGPPSFNNSDFITAFTQSFLSFARFYDPNDKFTPDIKPTWPLWTNIPAEMTFNRTESNKPLIQTRKTDPALLDRCRYVLRIMN